jgi:hypothetical protein
MARQIGRVGPSPGGGAVAADADPYAHIGAGPLERLQHSTVPDGQVLGRLSVARRRRGQRGGIGRSAGSSRVNRPGRKTAEAQATNSDRDGKQGEKRSHLAPLALEPGRRHM